MSLLLTGNSEYRDDYWGRASLDLVPNGLFESGEEGTMGVSWLVLHN